LRDRAELSPVTIAGYERHAEMLIRELGAIPLEKLTAGEIEAGLGRLRQNGGKVQKRLKQGAVADSRPLAPRTMSFRSATMRSSRRGGGASSARTLRAT
jgi:hypothetical protein